MLIDYAVDKNFGSLENNKKIKKLRLFFLIKSYFISLILDLCTLFAVIKFYSFSMFKINNVKKLANLTILLDFFSYFILSFQHFSLTELDFSVWGVIRNEGGDK